MCACVCVFQAEEGGVGAEDVGSAGEQEGADGAAGRADEASEGELHTHTHRYTHTHTHAHTCMQAETSTTRGQLSLPEPPYLPLLVPSLFLIFDSLMQ